MGKHEGSWGPGSWMHGENSGGSGHWAKWLLIGLAIMAIMSNKRMWHGGGMGMHGMMGGPWGMGGRCGMGGPWGMGGRGMMGGHGMMGGYGWPGMMGYRWFGFTPVWMVLMLVFWLLVIGGIVALVWWFVRPGRSTIVEGDRSTQRGLEVLHERYARGEITKEQYDQMKRDILGS